jgi:hypothetical protein
LILIEIGLTKLAFGDIVADSKNAKTLAQINEQWLSVMEI